MFASSVQLGTQLEQRLGMPVSDTPGNDEDHRQPARRVRAVLEHPPPVPSAGGPEALPDNITDGNRFLVIDAALHDLIKHGREILAAGVLEFQVNVIAGIP